MSKHHDEEDILGIYHAPKPKQWTIQRRWPRQKVDLRVKVHLRVDREKTFVFGQGNDISEGGLAAYVPAELHVGDRVDIEVLLPYGKRPIVITAEVRNRNSFRYGFEFVGIQDEDREILVRSVMAISLTK